MVDEYDLSSVSTIFSGAAAELDGADVVDFAAERVAPYKKVRAVQFIDEVPKSAAGKVLRKDLRADA